MNVYSSQELKAVDYHPRPDGFADIRLRRNIQKVTREQIDPAGDPIVEWAAEEQYICAQIAEADVADVFDQLWETAVRDSKTLDERLEDAEESADDSGDAVAELGDMVAEHQTTLEDQDAAIAELGDLVASMKGGEQ